MLVNVQLFASPDGICRLFYHRQSFISHSTIHIVRILLILLTMSEISDQSQFGRPSVNNAQTHKLLILPPTIQNMSLVL